MKIETKFNINDEIFSISRSLEDLKWRIAEGTFIIEEISVVKDLSVCYIITPKQKNGWQYDVREQDCFATLEEAKKECDKRNRK